MAVETRVAPRSAEEVAAAAARLLRYAFMKLTRDLDARFESLLLTGKVTKWYSEVGSEATTVPAGLALAPGDALCTLHRDLGAILAVYLDPARTFPGLGFGEPDGRRPEPVALLHRLCCQLLGKDEGFSRGVERSFHYGFFDAAAGLRHVGMISHLGSMIPVAAGCAFALQREGRGGVAINFIGDGGTSTGDFHEGLNFAAVQNLPLIVVAEHNGWAYSTPTSKQMRVEHIAAKAPGYGIPGRIVDGNDVLAVYEATREAVERARGGGGPTLIEAKTFRMKGHAEHDDAGYVPPEQFERWAKRDPIERFERHLTGAGIAAADELRAIESAIARELEAEVDFALASPLPPPERALEGVYE